MRVLFIASDNNKVSGAFLSMVKLNVILRSDFGVFTKVVLPREGDGQTLLEENGIPYVLFPTIDWIVDKNETYNQFALTRKMKRAEKTNSESINKIVDLIRDEKYDLVHLNTIYARIGEIAAMKANVPFVWQIREIIEEGQGRVIYYKDGYQELKNANRVIAISTSVYDAYKKRVPDARIVTIHNGIDSTRFYNPDKTIMNNDHIITLAYVGGYGVRKGIFELASALNYLRSIGIDNFRLMLIGEPTKRYIEYLHKTGLEDYVDYIGYQKNVESYLKSADIAFNCSVMEAFGRTTAEAMFCGCLMIASNSGGSLDIVKDGETGFLYQQGDPLSLAYTILYAMNHREESKKIAENGRNDMMKRFTAKKNAFEIFKLYQNVLAECK